MNKKALILIDFINEIIHPKWKLSKKWYYDFAQENNSIENIKTLLKQTREKKDEIIHVKISFSKNYENQPKHSPLFWKAHEFQVLEENTWSSNFLDELKAINQEKIFVKTRVSAFFETWINKYLKSKNIKNITIIGVATDLAVESAVREAHDRDYSVNVIADCCIAANMQDHQNSLKLMSKIAVVL